MKEETALELMQMATNLTLAVLGKISVSDFFASSDADALTEYVDQTFSRCAKAVLREYRCCSNSSDNS